MTTRIALRWLPTFIGFPLGGLAAELIVGPVDGLAAALLGGAIAGVVLGAVQSWGRAATAVLPVLSGSRETAS